MEELKRRDLSGIYIFDKFPTDEKRHPTCLEDCQQETRRQWCMASSEENLKSTIEILAQTFKDICNYLVDEKCVAKETRKETMNFIVN